MGVRDSVLGVTIRARGGERGRLLSWPRPYPENAYLGRLADALAGERITTLAHRTLAALALAPRGARWLHVHWPEWMLRDPSRVRARARAVGFFALLDSFRARGIRVAWTAHNLLGHDEPHDDLARAARRALLARCDVVFGHFAAAEADVRALGFRGRFALTPHPGYGEDYPAAPAMRDARAALGLPREGRVLLAYGAIEPYKGLDVLTRAFVRDAPPSTQLVIAGRAASDQALAAVRAAASGDPRVRIEPTFVARDRTALLFGAADALVLAYRAFYTSGTAMLALSFGTPVIGPARHHLASLVGREFFVPMDAPEALRTALDALDRLSPDARQTARQYAGALTWPRVARVVATTLFGAP